MTDETITDGTTTVEEQQNGPTVADKTVEPAVAEADGGLREQHVAVEPGETQAPAIVTSVGTVPAKAQAEPTPKPTTIPVHEVVINSDTVILDPNHPLAVQPLEHDPENTLTPIGKAAVSGQTPEAQFAENE